jgi:SagB-type dehydrogenase family enzyme
MNPSPVPDEAPAIIEPTADAVDLAAAGAAEPVVLPAQVRAIDPLVFEVSRSRPGKVLISSPRLPGRLQVGQAVVPILLAAAGGLATAGQPPAVISRLLQAGFLVDAAEPAPVPGAPWDAWGATAWGFYRQTKDVSFVSTDPVKVSAYRGNFARSPRPASVRAPVSDRILLLPRVRSALDVSFRDVLEGRRTHRHFVDQPMTLDAFADLLHYSFAPLRFADADELGVMQLRAAASSGARHESEAFVFVLNVESVRPGLYHYDNLRHGLEPIRSDVGRAELEHLTFGQGFFTSAACGVLTAAVAERMSWKYPHPVAYRMLLHNVGHVAQVFSMTASALGYGASLTGAIRGTEADAMLGLRQPAEFTTFALACGLPVRGEHGLPLSIRLPADPPEYY